MHITTIHTPNKLNICSFLYKLTCSSGSRARHQSSPAQRCFLTKSSWENSEIIHLKKEGNAMISLKPSIQTRHKSTTTKDAECGREKEWNNLLWTTFNFRGSATWTNCLCKGCWETSRITRFIRASSCGSCICPRVCPDHAKQDCSLSPSCWDSRMFFHLSSGYPVHRKRFIHFDCSLFSFLKLGALLLSGSVPGEAPNYDYNDNNNK